MSEINWTATTPTAPSTTGYPADSVTAYFKDESKDYTPEQPHAKINNTHAIQGQEDGNGLTQMLITPNLSKIYKSVTLSNANSIFDIGALTDPTQGKAEENVYNLYYNFTVVRTQTGGGADNGDLFIRFSNLSTASYKTQVKKHSNTGRANSYQATNQMWLDESEALASTGTTYRFSGSLRVAYCNPETYPGFYLCTGVTQGYQVGDTLNNKVHARNISCMFNNDISDISMKFHVVPAGGGDDVFEFTSGRVMIEKDVLN